MNYKTIEDVERVISLSKPDKVINMFVSSYLQGEAYASWIATKEVEYRAEYPLLVDGNLIFNEEGDIEGYEQIENPDMVEFDVWMAETEEVQVGTTDVFKEDGITVVGQEPVFEERLLREYSEVDVDIEGWKFENYAMLRSAYYPKMEEYLDAYVKTDADALEGYRQACLAVKERFKKPAGL